MTKNKNGAEGRQHQFSSQEVQLLPGMETGPAAPGDTDPNETFRS